MSRYDKIVDLYFTDSGDFMLGQNNDIKDTIEEQYRGFVQMVVTRLSSAAGDWALAPTVGANLDQFVGRPNTRDLANAIRSRVLSELQSGGLVRGNELSIEIFPVSKTSLAMILAITPPRSEGQVVLTFTYSMKENKLIPRNF
jgi:hypothetical protein